MLSTVWRGFMELLISGFGAALILARLVFIYLVFAVARDYFKKDK